MGSQRLSTEWCIFDPPTPGQRGGALLLGHPSQPATHGAFWFYDNAQTVQLASAIQRSSAYTLDGSVPGPIPHIPEDGLTAYTTTVWRESVFEFNNMLPSGTQDESYFIDALDHELPSSRC